MCSISKAMEHLEIFFHKHFKGTNALKKCLQSVGVNFSFVKGQNLN